MFAGKQTQRCNGEVGTCLNARRHAYGTYDNLFYFLLLFLKFYILTWVADLKLPQDFGHPLSKMVKFPNRFLALVSHLS